MAAVISALCVATACAAGGGGKRAESETGGSGQDKAAAAQEQQGNEDEAIIIGNGADKAADGEKTGNAGGEAAEEGKGEEAVQGVKEEENNGNAPAENMGTDGNAENPGSAANEANAENSGKSGNTENTANSADGGGESAAAAGDDGSAAGESAAGALPITEPLNMYFSSGAGGWSTDIILNPDGSFTGEYHDSEMGDTGEGYPDGSIYISEFKGRFTDIRKVDENCYSMKMGKLEYVNVIEGDEEIEDDVRYIQAEAYGLTDSDKILLYTPDTIVKELSADIISWWPGRYELEYDEAGDPIIPEDMKLGVYCVANISSSIDEYSGQPYVYGFFS